MTSVTRITPMHHSDHSAITLRSLWGLGAEMQGDFPAFDPRHVHHRADVFDLIMQRIEGFLGLLGVLEVVHKDPHLVLFAQELPHLFDLDRHVVVSDRL